MWKAFIKIFNLLLISGACVTIPREFYFFIVCLEGVLPVRRTALAEERCTPGNTAKAHFSTRSSSANVEGHRELGLLPHVGFSSGLRKLQGFH